MEIQDGVRIGCLGYLTWKVAQTKLFPDFGKGVLGFVAIDGWHRFQHWRSGQPMRKSTPSHHLAEHALMEGFGRRPVPLWIAYLLITLHITKHHFSHYHGSWDPTALGLGWVVANEVEFWLFEQHLEEKPKWPDDFHCRLCH